MPVATHTSSTPQHRSNNNSSSVSLRGSGAATTAADIKSSLKRLKLPGLAGYPDPCQSYGSKGLDLPFYRLLKAYKTSNLAPKPQLALPVQAIQQGVKHYNTKGKPRDLIVADLLTIAFFFLLCPGEYTMQSPCSKTSTVQFHRKEARCFKDGSILPHTATLEQLLQANLARLYINNQKNGQRGSTMFHTANELPFCQINALARRVHHLHWLAPINPLLPISFLAPGTHVASGGITLAVSKCVALPGLLNSRYNPTRVSAHLLRASRAMALRLNNVGEDHIKKLGRWSSSTWLTYIHSQILSLTVGLSERMTIHHVFYNVSI
jgi:hypothetical protein